MSESQNYQEVTVVSNGITVIKTFEADAFPVPAIAFRIQSDRAEPVEIRLVDDVPESVAVEDLGFHPEYGSEYWTIEDDEITFEREIEPDEQYTTVYGIRATGTDNVEQFLTEPALENVDPPLEGEDTVVSESGSDVVRDVISGDADSVPGLEEDAEDAEDIGTLDLADPSDEEMAEGDDEPDIDVDLTGDDDGEEDETEDGAAATEAETDSDDEADSDDVTEEAASAADGEPTATAMDVDNFAAALADDIREGDVDDDDLDVIKDALDLGDDEGSDGTNGALEARIDNLRSDVSSLDAYTDALEEFLEENGKGQDLIDDLQSKIDSFEETLDGMEDSVTDNTDSVTSLEETVSDIRDDLQTLKGDVKDVNDELDDLEEQFGDSERVEELEDEIEELQEWREQLTNVLGASDD